MIIGLDSNLYDWNIIKENDNRYLLIFIFKEDIIDKTLEVTPL